MMTELNFNVIMLMDYEMAVAFSSFQMEIHFPDSTTMEKETGWEPISFQMAQNMRETTLKE